MPLIKAFPGLRPGSGRAADVAAPPYDVMNEAEARRMVRDRPWSFLHISRPEVDLPVGSDPYAAEAYTRAAHNLAEMRRAGVLQQDAQDCYYAYRLTMGAHVQLGLVAAASVTAYDQGRIKKHEHTRPPKEDDRVRQIEALQAQTGPVFLVYPALPAADVLLAEVAGAAADIDVTIDDQVRHQLWVISEPRLVAQLDAAFETLPGLYVADGHHRSAAASRVAAARRSERPGLPELEPCYYFLAVLFPHDQVQILDYNRVVRDLNGLSREQFLQRIGEQFELTLSDRPVRPSEAGEFGMYLPQQWYRLRIDKSRLPSDPVAALDVSLLADHLLQPVLGIGDLRRDQRIDFVGGVRGLEGLRQRVDSGEMAVAFALYPTGMEALMAVADSGGVMPPKSTWFEPKLADGLVSHLI